MKKSSAALPFLLFLPVVPPPFDQLCQCGNQPRSPFGLIDERYSSAVSLSLRVNAVACIDGNSNFHQEAGFVGENMSAMQKMSSGGFWRKNSRVRIVPTGSVKNWEN